MLQKNNGSYQREINSFFDGLDLPASSFPTSSALCQARAKVSHKAFIELNENAVETFYQFKEYQTWKGHRLLSIDGSTLQLPKHESIEKEFGIHKFGPKADSAKSLARISYLYDVLNGVVIDAQMNSFATSEAELAWEHLKFLKRNDVVIFDKYYPSTQLMSMLKSMGVHFCFKMKKDWWTKVKKFTQGRKLDQKVCFDISSKYNQWAEENEMPEMFYGRLIKSKNRKGEIEILCTSLLSKRKYRKKDICNLYKERWNIEEGYKLIKSRLEVEEFSGVKSLVVKQDFYCKTLILTINAIMCQKIKPSINKIKDRVININKTLGLTTTKKMLAKIALGWEIIKVVEYYTNVLTGKFNYSRKGQSNPRNKCHQKFSMNYKTA